MFFYPRTLLLCLLFGLVLMAETALAATEAGWNGFGRYRIDQAFGGQPVYGAGSWGPSSGTFGFAPETGTASWAQFLQFDTLGVGTAFGAAEGYTLTLQGVATGGRAYAVYVGSGSANVAAAGGGNNLIDTSGAALGGTLVATDLVLQGTVELGAAEYPALAAFLEANDYATNRYIYVTLRAVAAGSTGGTCSFAGSSLVAIAAPPPPPGEGVRSVWSTAVDPTVGVEPSFVSVTTDADRIYAVVVPADRSARVVAMDALGNELTSTVIVPAGGVTADPHYGFSVGIDRDGFLHVSGNMHNGLWQYWVSTTPRSAAAFQDLSTPSTNQMWGSAKIGSWVVTYPNFFRDNLGRLWLTARVKARDDESMPGSLSGLRGGMLALYDPVRRVWDAMGARAPAPGNTWRMPVVTWDETGRAQDPVNAEEWYQSYRLNLDFDDANDLHLAWVAWGSRAEGAPLVSELTPTSGAGGTHVGYLRRESATGRFVNASGVPVTLPANRTTSAVLYANPGDLHFAAFVAGGASPMVAFLRGGSHWLTRRENGQWTAPAAIPSTQPDVVRQIAVGPNGRLVFLDGNRILVSTDHGATWSTLAAPSLRQIDKARFRRTGQLVGVSLEAGTLAVVEVNLEPSAGPSPADDPDYATNAGEPLVVAAPGVLGNDFHSGWETLTASLAVGPAHGAVVLGANGGFTYTPPEGFTGTDTFTYRVTDTSGREATAVATVQVLPGAAEAQVHEGFDIQTGALGNQAGGSSFGFASSWQNNYLAPAGSALTVGAGSLFFDYAGIPGTVGNRLEIVGNGTVRTAFRPLARENRFSFGEDGVRYLSFLARVASSPSAGDLQSVMFTDRFGDAIGGWLRYANNRITASLGGVVRNSTDAGQSGQTFASLSGTPEDRLVVVKIVTRASGEDELFVKTFVPGQPIVEPVATGAGADTWAVAVGFNLDARVVAGVRVALRDQGLGVDELRLGRTFASVTEPTVSPEVIVFASTGSVTEGGFLPFQISRGSPAGSLLVRYAFSGSAAEGRDFTATSGELLFPEGVSVLAVDPEVLRDGLPEDDESVTLTLLPDPAYPIGGSGSATVTIPFNDLVNLDTLTFEQEPGTAQILRLRLTNPKAEAITVEVNTQISQALSYTPRSSAAPGGPAFEWHEISGTGTRLTALDGAYATPNVLIGMDGFVFPFYGQPVSELIITPNGLIGPNLTPALDLGFNYRTQQQMPGVRTAAIIAPLWEDWHNANGIFVQRVDADTFVVQYEGVLRNLSSSSPAPAADGVSFQVILKSSGVIRFAYREHNLAQHTYSIGIQNPGGTEGINTHFSFIESVPFITNGLLLEYLPPATWLVPRTTTLTLAAGESREIEIDLSSVAFTGGHQESGNLLVTLPGLARQEIVPLQMSVGALSPRARWRLDTYGTTLDHADSADFSDPLATGLPNLMHYALGRHPLDPPDSLPAIVSSAGEPAFQFRRARADVNYIVEESLTLAPDSWTEVVRNPGAPGEEIAVSIPSPSPRVFLRLRVSEP